MSETTPKHKKIKLLIGLAIGAVVAITLGVLLGGKLYGVLFNGKGLFDKETQATPAPTDNPGGIVPIKETEAPSASPTATPEPTPDPYEELANIADKEMMHDIVNILFIGVDYEEARTENSWAGKDGNAFHSDVMMVCAVNFNENKVDLISLPRDTYANIPGVNGVYKLNASLNCGTDGTNYGLYCKNGEGFEKVCEAAKWMLGGIDVDYYYAVTMESVKEIVDTIGGVWYDLEGDFDNGGRYYKAGYQLMDGQACLDYMRVRKGGHGDLATGDANRVNRQKNMLLAIFKTMQNGNMILKIPDMISAFDGALYTNCTTEQTAALALFAYKLDAGNIGMHSMSGSGATLFHWNFTFTDQSNRVDIIKQVYGVSVSGYSKYTLAYGRYRWASMLEETYMNLCDPLEEYVQKLIDADDLLPESSPSPTPEVTLRPSDSPAPTVPAETPWPTVPPTATPEPEGDTPGRSSGLHLLEGAVETRKYTQEQRDLFDQYKEALQTLKDLYKSTKKEADKASSGKSNSLSSYAVKLLDQMEVTQDLAIAVAKSFEYTQVKNFTVTCYATSTYTNSPWALNYWNDKTINAIKVNFN